MMKDNPAPAYGSHQNTRSANRTETALDAIRIRCLLQGDRKFHPLLDKVYEALAESDDEKCIAALVQVAAVCVGRIVAIERRLASHA